MARLTQTQLAGFRVGTTPATETEPRPDAPRRRDPAAPTAPTTRQPSTRTAPASTPLPDPGDDRASPFGSVPPAPTRTEARYKVGLTLPLDIAERVRALTRQGYALADLVMVAYQNQRGQLLEEHEAARPRRLVRHAQGRSPLTLALSHAERAALDALAEHLGWTRSHTVAALLEHQLHSTK